MDDSGVEQSEYKFTFPSFQGEYAETEEIERVKGLYGIKAENFVERFIEEARRQQLVRLTDDIWDKLDNTDSRSGNILRGDWDAVAKLAGGYERDWQDTKRRMQKNEPLDAPIIVRRGNELHLVAGNTRLMCCRAFGMRPDVLIVDITDFE